MAMENNKITLAPLRRLDDFLLGSARFQLPNYKDMDKWGNRVVQNLLYYQTNYFLTSIILILIVTLMYPVEMACGGLSMLLMYSMFSYMYKTKRSLIRLQKNYPFVGVGLMILGSIFLVSLLHCLLVFMFGILLPISAMFLHASLRLRNTMNKLSNLERIVSNKTPMGIFLNSVGMESTLFS